MYVSILEGENNKLFCVSTRLNFFNKSLSWMCSTANYVLPLRRTCEVGLSETTAENQAKNTLKNKFSIIF